MVFGSDIRYNSGMAVQLTRKQAIKYLCISLAALAFGLLLQWRTWGWPTFDMTGRFLAETQMNTALIADALILLLLVISFCRRAPKLIWFIYMALPILLIPAIEWIPVVGDSF